MKEIFLKLWGWGASGVSWCVGNKAIFIWICGGSGTVITTLRSLRHSISLEVQTLICYALIILASFVIAVVIGLYRDRVKAIAARDVELAAFKAVPGPPSFLSFTKERYLDWVWYWRWKPGTIEPAVSSIEELFCYCPDCNEPVLPSGFGPSAVRQHFGTEFRCKGCGRRRDMSALPAEVYHRVKASIYRDALNPPPIWTSTENTRSAPGAPQSEH